MPSARFLPRRRKPRGIGNGLSICAICVPILEKVNFQVDAGERVCLLGRNGAGKSTLMKVIAGEMKPDTGEVFRQPGALFTRLTQEVPTDLSTAPCTTSSPAACAPPATTRRTGSASARRGPHRAPAARRPHVEFSALSGGLKRRARCWPARWPASPTCCCSTSRPTTSTSIPSSGSRSSSSARRSSLFFVTHDRAFLRKLATRIVELDRGRLTSWACDYDTYLVRKQEVLEAEERSRRASTRSSRRRRSGSAAA
jgi:ATP-binding cassette subfamily F protein uup